MSAGTRWGLSGPARRRPTHGHSSDGSPWLLPSGMQAQVPTCSNFPQSSSNLDSSMKTSIFLKKRLAANSIEIKHVCGTEDTQWGCPKSAVSDLCVLPTPPHFLWRHLHGLVTCTPSHAPAMRVLSQKNTFPPRFLPCLFTSSQPLLPAPPHRVVPAPPPPPDSFPTIQFY